MDPPKIPLVLGQPSSPPRSFSELDEEGNSQLERPVPKSKTFGISAAKIVTNFHNDRASETVLIGFIKLEPH